MHADEWSRTPDGKGRLKGIFRGKLPDNALAQPVFLYKAVRRVNGEKK
jgi:hypothetical protein